jgi:Protein of unknown function (DUF3048) N-terminal domain/Protein of unknown function (DUF3048) C-terminal domain
MSLPTRPLRAAAASLAAATLLASAGCSGDSKPKKSATPTPTPPTTSSTTAAAPAAPARNPFTGIGGVPNSPVIAVKIDDTAPGRPQVGINKADIVYIEAVEGGLTRLAAVFGTSKPAVGYVRSTRPSDPDLLLQFGKITEAYSGGAHDSLPRVRRSGITSWSNDAGAPYYSRVTRSSAYINLVLNLAKVARKTKTNRPRNIGWTFSAADTGLGGTKGTDVRTVVRGSNRGGTAVEFRYDARSRRYIRYIDGQRQVDSAGRSISAANVIVQFCRVVAHPADTDVNGNPSQFTYTVGKGSVAVFRHGKRINGHWSRPNLNAGTTLTTAAGRRLPLVPGNTWVVLATNGTPLSG